jgi:fluoride exporter
VRVAATHNVRRERVERFRTQYPAPFSSNPEFVTAVRAGIFHLADIEHNPDAPPEQVEFARLAGYHTRLMAPMMRGDSVLGIIAVTREAPTPFPERQVERLKTFAAQAVIAIENVRLFKELEARNRDLTASSEILQVILAHQLWFGTEFPYGTLIVNLTGSFVIGVVQQLGAEALMIPDNTRMFLTTGMMGGLTTYSTFSYETVRLMETGAWSQAWINIFVTTVICLSLCYLGMGVGRIFVTLRG